MDTIGAGLASGPTGPQLLGTGAKITLGACEGEVRTVDAYEACGGAVLIRVDAKVFGETGVMADGIARVVGVFDLWRGAGEASARPRARGTNPCVTG